MEEIVKAIEKIAEKNIIDYLLVIVPIVASLIAIVISIVVSQKQNKIALFEKRFDAYANLLKLKAFSDMLKKEECSFDPKVIAAANAQNVDGERGRRCGEILLNFQAFFYDGEKKPDAVNVARVTLYTIRNVELSLQTLPMLYSKTLKDKGNIANKEITKIFEDLTLFMNSLITCDRNNDQYREGFVAKMDLFVDKYSNIFEKGIRL